MKFVYWNSKKHTDFATIKGLLADDVCPDVLFLAETDEKLIVSNYSELKKYGYEHFENPGCFRIIIIKKLGTRLNLGMQSDRFSALRDPENDVTIVSVHLPSQLHRSMDQSKLYFRQFRHEVDNEFGSSVEKNILIIGDFNVNPFETPMIGFDGFSASNSKNLRKEVTRDSELRELYYNPTWTLYGKNMFPGTLYYDRPSGFSFDILEHHFLDQVVMSYCLSKKIAHESISIVKSTVNTDFLDNVTNKTTHSDHLPLSYEYKLA
jgi:hypothetical protein